MTATSFIKRGGVSRPSLNRTILVVSSESARRADWATYFEELGLQTRRCVGPLVLCALLEGQRHCPLQDEADLAVYDHESYAPELRARLLHAARPLPIAIAHDRLTADGHHEPVLVEVPSPAQRANW